MSMPHNPGFQLLGSAGLLELYTVVVLIVLEEVSPDARCCNGDASVVTRKVYLPFLPLHSWCAAVACTFVAMSKFRPGAFQVKSNKS